jgi:hypothetical protein
MATKRRSKKTKKKKKHPPGALPAFMQKLLDKKKPEPQFMRDENGLLLNESQIKERVRPIDIEMDRVQAELWLAYAADRPEVTPSEPMQKIIDRYTAHQNRKPASAAGLALFTQAIVGPGC